MKAIERRDAAARGGTARALRGALPRRSPGLTTTALLVLAVAAVVGCSPAGSPDPAAGAAGGSEDGTASVRVPAATPARPCNGLEQRIIPAPTELAVFERRQHKPDGLPDFHGARNRSWLPATTLLPTQARRAGLDRFDAEVHLVPTLGVRPDGRCQPDTSQNAGEGVCLTVGVGEGVAVRCFTDEAIRAGRAVALTGPAAAGRPPDEVHGIVPDGVASVRLAWRGGRARAAVVDNAFEARLPGVRAGQRLALSFSGPSVAQRNAACRPSPALLDAVPALRGELPVSAPPERLAAVVDVAPALVDRWARAWGGEDGVSFRVVPQLRCGVTITDDRACVATVRGVSDIVEGVVCADAATIRRRGASGWHPVDGRPVIAGFAPSGASAARVALPERDDEVVPVRDGVFAAFLDPEVRMDRPDAYGLSFER